jgi:hypothetical protein
MDATSDLEECKKINVLYTDYEVYKKHYNVLETWQEIEDNLLKNYVPNRIKISTSCFDPEGKYNDLIKSLRPNFYKNTKNAFTNSLKYVFNLFGKSYVLQIRNGKLVNFAYLHNKYYTNYLSKHLIVEPKYSAKYRGDKRKWETLAGMIKPFEKKYVGYAMDFFYSEIKYLFQYLCDSGEMSDMDIIISHKDYLTIKKNLTEPNEEVVGSTTYKLDPMFRFSEYSPIISFCWNERYANLPIIPPDDIIRIFKLYVAPKCSNHYLGVVNTPWEDRKAVAVFRGSFTGGSCDTTNPRLNISIMNTTTDLIDAGITHYMGKSRGRKKIDDKYIRFLDPSYEKYKVGYLSHQEQTTYKYIVCIEGNISAFRGAFLFSLNSVVLWVKPMKYFLWFEPYLKDKHNCVFIEHDLSNLLSTVEWLRENDDKAHEIANNGYQFYSEFLTEKAVEYSRFVLNSAIN